jgi:hypothetical protein
MQTEVTSDDAHAYTGDDIRESSAGENNAPF